MQENGNVEKSCRSFRGIVLCQEFPLVLISPLLLLSLSPPLLLEDAQLSAASLLRTSLPIISFSLSLSLSLSLSQTSVLVDGLSAAASRLCLVLGIS